MDLRVREAAQLLRVSEKTVYRWIRQGRLPAYRVHEQYRLNRVELQEWAALHGRPLSPDLHAAELPAREAPSLAAALERGGIVHGLPGRDRGEVLAALARLPAIPGSVDRDLLHEALVAREALASTGTGDGIAIPHARDPLIVHVDEPTVLLCFLERPIEFGAPDGRPVSVLFTLLSPSVRAHLQLLAKIAFLLHDAEFRRLLQRQAKREAILGRVRALEGAGRAAQGTRADTAKGASA